MFVCLFVFLSVTNSIDLIQNRAGKVRLGWEVDRGTGSARVGSGSE